jgi:hypothetical protein
MAWRQVKVIFTPKPGKSDCTEAKAYCPISLLSFLLKTTEILVDRYIREGVLKEHLLHRNQHAYPAGKSTEIALLNVVTRIESGIECKKIALRTSLNIEGDFDNVTTQAAERHGTEPTICR